MVANRARANDAGTALRDLGLPPEDLFAAGYTDGNATVCCWDVHERAVIGNVLEQSVQEIWESYAANSIRAMLDDGRRDLITLCSRCNAYEDYDFGRFEVSASE